MAVNEGEVLLFEQDYDIGQKVTFSLYRKAEGDEVTISLRYRFPEAGEDEITCKRLFFPLCAEEYQSPYLSWYNLICCSNYYGPIPVVSYMNYSVQNGKKVAATIYPNTADEYLRIIGEAGDEFSCVPFHTMEYEYMLYISRTGCLADFFDLDRILAVYEKSGVSLERERIKDYFGRELSWFANEDECPLKIHDCQGDEELMVLGLLFGYPVESTIALINKTIDTCQ